MEFTISEAEALEAARIEDEAGCPAIGAGLELGANGAAYLGFVVAIW